MTWAFASPELRARELAVDEVPRLQAFFDANPQYFMVTNGRPANPDEARVEFDERPPAHIGFSRSWVFGLFDRDDRLQGTAIVVSDLGAAGVWHVALFIVATALHGRGIAARIHAALERWMIAAGARWLRLAVVSGNAAGERFWERAGYRDVRTRTGDTGGRVNVLRVMVKPVGDGDEGTALNEYLERVPRDRPDSHLP